ncbi:hypothetical protein AAF712_012002 [Marasmius tenuissimus]|uniref:Uncharacterized protein n=1 Tax=Marasmius tenuissimus TaxID=585030 RepID=A0ABR2ZL52_9AGAR
MAIDLTAEDLRRNSRTFDTLNKSLTFEDGLTAVLSPETRHFVTSPNRSTIPHPPLGSTRDLYLRRDGFYGPDDPVQYPQPLNSNYTYLACVPTPPISMTDMYFDDLCMWEKDHRPSEFSIDDGHESRALSAFSTSINRLRQRTKALLLSQPAWKHRFVELDLTIDLCLHRLRSPSTISPRNLTRAVSELQRAWRTAVSIIDFVEIYQPRMMATSDLKEVYQGTPHDQSTIRSRMGAFVWTPKDATLLFRAKLPVYYVREYKDFDRQIILEVTSFHDLPVNNNAAIPSHPVVYVGQAGSDSKFAVIRAESIGCFNSPSPFENLHLANAYQSSYNLGSGSIISPTTSSSASTSAAPSSGPVRTSSKKKVGTKAKGKTGPPVPDPHEGFSDLPTDDPFTPPPILAWKDANVSINKSHPEKRVMLPGDNPRLKTVAPDPATLLRRTDPSRTDFLVQWAHIREPFFRRGRGGDEIEIPVPLRAGVWRKVLTARSHGLYTKTDLPKEKQAKWHQEATVWLRNLFNRYAPGIEPVASLEAKLDMAEGRKFVYEVSMLNFWYQIMALDELADSTIPVSSPAASEAISRLEQANHRRHRLQLIQAIFGTYDDPFTAVTTKNEAHIASDIWAVRFPALKAFWRIMESWPGEKPKVWNRGNDPNILQMAADGFLWEKSLVQFYVQTYYNFLGFPPVLPRRR